MKDLIKIIALAILSLTSVSAFADPQSDNNPAVSSAAAPDDATLTQNVQSKIAAEPMLANKGVNVKANQGVIVLSAILDTSDQASKAIEIAQATPGVQDVDSSALTVKDSKQPMNDMATTAKIKGVFIKEKLFGNADVPVMTIHITTKNGVVYLTGTAISKDQIAKAVTLVQAIKDVKKVDTKVHVKKQ